MDFSPCIMVSIVSLGSSLKVYKCILNDLVVTITYSLNMNLLKGL